MASNLSSSTSAYTLASSSTSASTLSNDAELRRKRHTLERARATHLSRQLQLRLQYARLKVEHGWTKQNLNEVENLYFSHSATRRPPPARPQPGSAQALATSAGSSYGPAGPFSAESPRASARHSPYAARTRPSGFSNAGYAATVAGGAASTSAHGTGAVARTIADAARARGMASSGMGEGEGMQKDEVDRLTNLLYGHGPAQPGAAAPTVASASASLVNSTASTNGAGAHAPSAAAGQPHIHAPSPLHTSSLLPAGASWSPMDPSTASPSLSAPTSFAQLFPPYPHQHQPPQAQARNPYPPPSSSSSTSMGAGAGMLPSTSMTYDSFWSSHGAPAFPFRPAAPSAASGAGPGASTTTTTYVAAASASSGAPSTPSVNGAGSGNGRSVRRPAPTRRNSSTSTPASASASTSALVSASSSLPAPAFASGPGPGQGQPAAMGMYFQLGADGRYLPMAPMAPMSGVMSVGVDPGGGPGSGPGMYGTVPAAGAQVG